MNSRPFVANVDDPNAVSGDMVPNWLEVAALQTENSINSALFEKARNPRRTAVLAGTEIFR
jgi:hypothetical protein